MTWNNDVPGYDSRHESTFDTGLLRRLASVSDPNPAATTLPQRVLWSAEQQRAAVPDVNHEAYMSDDSTLHKALLTLHTHGLLFLTKVPEQQTSVSAIAERIGPLKTTFYGSTWDVRSVPQAKNVAYTAQDLGFHMDLLYMRQPPHLQFLHCIRSSSAGGASLFTDSFRAAQDLWHQDPAAFLLLTKLRAGFHYNHPDSHYYQCSHSTIDLQPPGARGPTADILKTLVHSHDVGLDIARTTRGNVKDWLHSVAWAPPFQAPFNEAVTNGSVPTLRRVNSTVHRWHTAAMKFNALIHKPEGIYERMMKPGECVIFDNRRVLHGRRAFEVEDAGKERWLRGAYLDLDPYLSKLRVLGRKFGSSTVPGESSMAQDVEIG
ncbi:hypothetical protein B0A55_01083 [Friedmanniomyces simplex]|uniref:TauD/TfdA-like domain-containing protein n=1 Tax=Friedmanniomyces simplex TaxID=329884 RepID=A0A4U0Y5A1_9PEZI|nr:hypothetical protein B0A55_01083 [Friedmanniomyces simplex]